MKSWIRHEIIIDILTFTASLWHVATIFFQIDHARLVQQRIDVYVGPGLFDEIRDLDSTFFSHFGISRVEFGL